MFCRIQNLHISQTRSLLFLTFLSFVEFKIYISLKLRVTSKLTEKGFVEFKIYISLKLKGIGNSIKSVFCRIQNLHISQTNLDVLEGSPPFCRIQNLHISQTAFEYRSYILSFVEFKIYISLKRI